MNHDDAPFSTAPEQPSKSLSIIDLLQEIENWRAIKTTDEPIPDQFWEKIFSFAGTYSTSRICAILGINSTQYRKKREQFQNVIPLQGRSSPKPSPHQTETPLPPSSPPAEEEWQELQPEKAYDPITGLSLHTVIVELCRPDGHRLKIHTTTQSFKEIFRLFLNNEIPYDTTQR